MGIPMGWELVIILIIVLLVFGVGRIAKLGGELGKSVSSFRQGLREGMEDNESEGDVSELKSGESES